MKNASKNATAITSSALMIAAMGAGALSAANPSVAVAAESEASIEVPQSSQLTTLMVMPAVVEGHFSFSQGVITPLDVIAKNMGNAPTYFCGAHPAASAETSLDEAWTIEVVGAVANEHVVAVEEVTEEDTESLVMGCSCTGNPAGGAASVNAEVTGISVAKIIRNAVPAEGANTIVFTSADGYEIALPIEYVKQRYCPIVFDVNGAPLMHSVGGVNQLWLGSTSAQYFARDIVKITIEERESPPPTPGSEEAGVEYANLPNVSVTYGGSAA